MEKIKEFPIMTSRGHGKIETRMVKAEDLTDAEASLIASHYVRDFMMLPKIVQDKITKKFIDDWNELHKEQDNE